MVMNQIPDQKTKNNTAKKNIKIMWSINFAYQTSGGLVSKRLVSYKYQNR